MERPQYKKVYSNKTMSKREEGAVGGGYSEERDRDCCCPLWLIALLACLALTGLVLGLLFGLGVIGGKGGN